MRSKRHTPFVGWLERQLALRGIQGPSAAARAIGLPQSNVSNYLNGNTTPTGRSLRRLSEWSGEPVERIWALIPADADVDAGPVPAVVLPEEEVPAWARKMQEQIDALAARGVHLPRASLDRPSHPVTSETGHRPAILTDLGPGRWLTTVATDDLMARDPPIPFNAALWLDEDRPPKPNDVVVVEVDATIYFRVVGPDGVTLLSRVAGARPLRLDAVDRFYGTGTLQQVTL